MPTYSSPNASQVVTYNQANGDCRWLGTLGHVTGLQYGFNLPGGCDKFQCNLDVEPNYRTDAMNPGRIVEICRGASIVWNGVLDEPQPGTSGWTITGVGAGNQGTNMSAIYTDPWPTSEPDEAINNAIGRGLNWVNPGVGTPAGAWFGQEVDSGDQTISDLLNLVCTRGGLTWYVNSQPGTAGNVLSVLQVPTTVNYLLVSTTPVGRTLGGNYNTIWLRYNIAADNSTTGAAATYGTTSVTNAQSIALYGPLEVYIDLSNAGVMTAGQAQTVGQYVLNIYQRATFAGPFTVQPGQLLTIGGTPVDLGCVQAGAVCQLILTDFGYGGELTPQFPITFVIGTYLWDDQNQVGTITPYQTLNQSMSSLLSLEGTLLTPITTG